MNPKTVSTILYIQCNNHTFKIRWAPLHVFKVNLKLLVQAKNISV